MQRLFLALALAAACKPIPVESTTPAGAAASPDAAADSQLAELARRIDPGPQPPLGELFPGWLKDQFGVASTGEAASDAVVAEAREAVAALDSLDPDDGEGRLRGAVRLGRGIVLAEQAVAAGRSDPELLAALAKGYRVLHALRMFDRDSVFGQDFARAFEVVRAQGVFTGAQLAEGLDALQKAAALAPALQLHATAQLLRAHPDHPTVPNTLGRAAQTQFERQDFAASIELRRRSIARLGQASATDHASLALACYAALDLHCGDMARKTAHQRGAEAPGEGGAALLQWTLKQVDASAEAARRALALAEATGAAELNERGHLLIALGRLDEAERLFKRLIEADPQDARPRTGLAVLALRRGYDVEEAVAQIRAGRELLHRDRSYYEVALGLIPTIEAGALMAEIARTGAAPKDLDRRFDEVMALATEFRAFDPARAAVLELIFAATREGLAKFMTGDFAAGLAVTRKLPAQALALTRKFPEVKDVWRLLFALVPVVPDGDKARALALTPVPEALRTDPDIRLRQVQTLLDIAVRWEDGVALAAAVQAAASLPAELDADTTPTIRATLDAVLGLRGDTAARQRALAGFTALAERQRGKARALALNNAAVLRAAAGDAGAAIKDIERALEAAPGALAARVNLAAFMFAANDRERLPEVLAEVASATRIAGLRLHALAWRAALGDTGHGDPKATRADFKKALAEETGREFFGRLLLGRWGAIDDGNLQVALSHAPDTGLLIRFDVTPAWWLVVPAPTFAALVPAKPPKSAKPH
ncbi:tetratricopeptide repeat protein [Nannocystis punicea]|uniref:Tetratricopeptide repeat protein n=1 Tax=Nannocystis punicea TaxID=2995304 RepID=A0ABY7GXU4_9BACT|nr:tetratricopeptide repeat protein [Nannocystis poenicansa]WAS91793.1 tetratricopeptide repeat protein [Nannocystis poenicansa]